MAAKTIRASAPPAAIDPTGVVPLPDRWSDYADRQRERTYRLALVALAAMVALPPLVDLRVDYAGFSAFLWLAVYFAPVAAFLRWRPMPRMRGAVEGALLVMLMTVPILIFSYAAMRLGFPMADDRLARWDAVLGLNAGAIVAFIGGLTWLPSLLGFAYVSFSFQILALPALLSLGGQPARGYWFVEAFFLTCVAAIAIAAFFPAIGSYSHFALSEQALGNVNPSFGYQFLVSFNQVRTDPDFVLSPGVASGIITFPSIHAAVAVLCAYAAWTIRLARVPFVVLNAAMFVSAVTHGAHYVVDVVAGGVLAVAVILLRRPVPDNAEATESSPIDRADPAIEAAAR